MRSCQIQQLDRHMIQRTVLMMDNPLILQHTRTVLPKGHICNQEHRKTFITQNGQDIKSQIGTILIMVMMAVVSTYTERKLMMDHFLFLHMLIQPGRHLKIIEYTSIWVDLFCSISGKRIKPIEKSKWQKWKCKCYKLVLREMLILHLEL